MRKRYFKNFLIFAFYLFSVTNVFGARFVFEPQRNTAKTPNSWVWDFAGPVPDEAFKDHQGGVYARLTERIFVVETFYTPDRKEGIRRLRYDHMKECLTGFVQCIKTSVKILDKDNKVLLERIFQEEIKCGQKKVKESLTVDWPSNVNIKLVKNGEALTSHMKSGSCQ